jgi:hypothetical protein
MCNLPTEVSESENIVRAVIFPYHFDRKKQKYTHRAFRPQPGTDRVSVIRLTHMGPDFCKRKGQELATDGGDKKYTGLAVITAAQIRSAGAEVYDVPADYCGHAEIGYGMIVTRDEPPDSALNKRLTELTKQIFKLAVYHEDPDPTALTWTGGPL